MTTERSDLTCTLAPPQPQPEPDHGVSSSATASSYERPPPRRPRRASRNPRARFLAEVLEHEGAQLRVRRPATVTQWWSEADHSLRAARGAAARGDIERGWALVHHAHRLQVHAYSAREIESELCYVRREAAMFRPDQRVLLCEQLDRVERLLPKRVEIDGPPAAVGACSPAAAALRAGPTLQLVDGRESPGQPGAATRAARDAFICALLIRDRCYANAYYELALLRRYHIILLLIALGIIGSALLASMFANPNFDEGIEQGWTAVGAALSGALGGIASALQRTTRRQRERLPEKVCSLVEPLSRPIIGAIAGMTVFLAVRAGIAQPSEQQVAYLLLVAFGAGFAERLWVRDPREESAERMPPEAGSSPRRWSGRVLEDDDDGGG